MFKVGDLVIPISKSIGKSFEESTVVQKYKKYMRISDIQYKYFVDNTRHDCVIICHAAYFLPKDLIPYGQDNEAVYPHLRDMKEWEGR